MHWKATTGQWALICKGLAIRISMTIGVFRSNLAWTVRWRAESFVKRIIRKVCVCNMRITLEKFEQFRSWKIYCFICLTVREEDFKSASRVVSPQQHNTTDCSFNYLGVVFGSGNVCNSALSHQRLMQPSSSCIGQKNRPKYSLLTSLPLAANVNVNDKF